MTVYQSCGGYMDREASFVLIAAIDFHENDVPRKGFVMDLFRHPYLWG